MQYYKPIEIDNFSSIQEKTLKFIESIDLKNKRGYHMLPNIDYINYCPEIMTAFSQYNIKPIAFATVITFTQEDNKLHIDIVEGSISPPFFKCRINIPILNCKGSFTEFYDANIDDFDVWILGNGIKYHYLKKDAVATKVDEVEIISPTIIRVHVPHRVNTNLATVPRISLTVKFDVDPVFLLDE